MNCRAYAHDYGCYDDQERHKQYESQRRANNPVISVRGHGVAAWAAASAFAI